MFPIPLLPSRVNDRLTGHYSKMGYVRIVHDTPATLRSRANRSIHRCNRPFATPCRTILPMTQKALVFLVVLTGVFVTAVAAATDLVDFTIVNRAQFSVPADWPVIANKSTSEKTVFAFQIPNSADEGTSDSSNLSIVATDLKTAEDRDAFQAQPSSTDHNAQEKKLVDGWGCSTFSAVQHSSKTQYVIWDCRRTIADCGVSVRMAWPHLPKNPPNFDNQMETVLSNFLTSVGPFKGIPKSGVLRRPAD